MSQAVALLGIKNWLEDSIDVDYVLYIIIPLLETLLIEKGFKKVYT